MTDPPHRKRLHEGPLPDRQGHNQGAIRRVLGSALTLLLPATLLAGCGVGPTTITYTAYQLTCCLATDVNELWQPGQEVDLHWIAQTSTLTTVNPTHKVVITTTLLGPYGDVGALKLGTGGTHAVQGSVITFDDRTPPPPGTVAVFLLPADLPSGFYNLDMKTDFGDGSSAGGGSIVRVGLP